MIRNYIQKNKSKVAIISSILFHSLFLFSFQLDESLGKVKTPVEFIELKIIAGPGESINRNNLKKINAKQAQKKIKTEDQIRNIKNINTTKSKIPLNSNTKKENIKNKENITKSFNQDINQSSKNQQSSIRGSKSKNKRNEIQRGKLKGKGKKAIVCRKCLEPIYSQKSIRKGLEGITIVKVTIDTSGLVIYANILNSSGHKDIDDASISAALKSTFQPISEKSIITIKYKHKIK